MKTLFRPLILSAPPPAALAPLKTTPDAPALSAVPASRNLAIDVLRGWAIVMMVFSHVGPKTRLSALVHLPLFVSAATWFFGLSGLVLGLVAKRRIEKSGVWPASVKILLRVRQLWIIHCVLMLTVILWHTATGRLSSVITPAEAGGWVSLLWGVAVLRFQSNEFMNILPMYIVFMGLAPLVLWAMRSRFTGGVVLVSLGLYLYSQTHSAFLRLTDPLSGEQVFCYGAWQFVFFAGLVTGYHRAEIKARLGRRAKRWLVSLAGGVFGVIFVLAQFQRGGLNRIGTPGYHTAFDGLFLKDTCSPLGLVYVGAMIFLAYYGVRSLLKSDHPAVRFLGPLELMGRSSLYCFLVHLFFSLAGRSFGLMEWNSVLQEGLTLGAVGAVYLMAKGRVLASVIPN